MKTWIASALLCGLVFGLGTSSALAGGGKGKKKAPDATFSKKDKNGDGALSESEFAGKKGGPKAETRFGRLDKNKDGKVTLAEMKATPKNEKEES